MSRNYLSIKIRHAKEDDTPTILEAQRAITLEPGQLIARPHELRDNVLRDKIVQLADHPRGVYFVTELEKEVIAHATLEPNPLEATQHVASLMIAVHLDHQGRGLGEKLTSHVIEWAKSRSLLEKIELQIRSTNVRALSLCKKMGFKEEGRWLRRVKLEDDQYVDDVLMGLWL